MRIIISSNIHWSIYNFRLDLINKLIQDGNEVIAVGEGDSYSERLKISGVKTVNLNINNNSINPFSDVLLLLEYISVYRKLKADLVLHNAIKPNIYGTLAAWVLGIPAINNISGLGTIFINGGVKSKIAQFLYKISQKKAAHVFFQNKFDYEYFLSKNMVHDYKSDIIPGSGIDTSKFVPQEAKNKSDTTFIFVGRFLKQKGILELIHAVEEIQNDYKTFKVKLVGKPYLNNESSLTPEEIERISRNEIFEIIEFTDDVIKEYNSADYLILPSYREGLSRVLIEAGSCGLPVITTNVPGCKDVIIHGFNGFLVEPKSSHELAQAMKKMLEMKPADKQRMAINARSHIIKNFGIEKVLNSYFKIINSLFKEINKT